MENGLVGIGLKIRGSVAVPSRAYESLPDRSLAYFFRSPLIGRQPSSRVLIGARVDQWFCSKNIFTLIVPLTDSTQQFYQPVQEPYS